MIKVLANFINVLTEAVALLLSCALKLLSAFCRSFARSRVFRSVVTAAFVVAGAYLLYVGRKNAGLVLAGCAIVSAIAWACAEPRKKAVPTPARVAADRAEQTATADVSVVETSAPAPVDRGENSPVLWLAEDGELPKVELRERNAFCEKVLEQEHVLIAGTTGSGKSVLLNSLIYNGMPKGRFFFIDPKRIDLRKWASCSNCLDYGCNGDECLDILDAVENIMWDRLKSIPQGEERYGGTPIYVVIDEMAFLLSFGREDVIDYLSVVMRLGRAANIHIIAATQAPNRGKGGGIPAELQQCFTASIGLRCRSAIESRQVVGIGGCEELPRYGRGKFWSPDGIKSVDIPMTSAAELKRVAAVCSE